MQLCSMSSSRSAPTQSRMWVDSTIVCQLLVFSPVDVMLSCPVWGIVVLFPYYQKVLTSYVSPLCVRSCWGSCKWQLHETVSIV
jgi:hypothetical protein